MVWDLVYACGLVVESEVTGMLLHGDLIILVSLEQPLQILQSNMLQKDKMCITV